MNMKNTEKAQIAFGAYLCAIGATAVVSIGISTVQSIATAMSPKSAEVAKLAPTVTPSTEETAEAQYCRERKVTVEDCAQSYALWQEASDAFDRVQSGRIEDNYSNFLDRQQQHKANLEYCAKNRTDWSCTDGQYAGQY